MLLNTKTQSDRIHNADFIWISYSRSADNTSVKKVVTGALAAGAGLALANHFLNRPQQQGYYGRPQQGYYPPQQPAYYPQYPHQPAYYPAYQPARC